MSKRDEKNDIEMGDESMETVDKDISIDLESLRRIARANTIKNTDGLTVADLEEAMEEMEMMRKGELPNKSWREMMKEIKEDKSNGKL